jgi:hypothetical protein
MGRNRAMTLICVYLLAKMFVFRNEHFQLVFKLKTTLLKIRAQDTLVWLGAWQYIAYELGGNICSNHMLEGLGLNHLRFVIVSAATVLAASSDTVESEWLQIKQCE